MRTAEEKETIISYNQAEDTASVFTFEPRKIRELRKCAEDLPEECKIVREGPEEAIEFEVPKKWIKVKPPKKLDLTEEQREVLRERMKRIRE